MRTKYLVVIALVFMILFSASTPVYASHTRKTQPTEVEKRLFDKILDRLEEHDQLIETKVDDVKKSLSEPVKIFFSCRATKGKAVDSVSIDVSTQLVSFDEKLAERHKVGILSGLYIWDCKAVKDSYTLTIECTNLLMLNPNFLIKEETEKDEKEIISKAENEMILYHEFLHGQLMINAMKDSSDSLHWREDACRFFNNNNNEIDYSPSDAEHKIISGLELDFISKVIEQSNGIVIVETIDNEQVGAGKFTHVVATFDEIGELAEKGFFVFARSINLEGVDILVSKEEETISVVATLQDASQDGLVRMFVMPKLGLSDVRIDLEIDDKIKSVGSQFIFTAKVQNLKATDTAGSIALSVDGFVIQSKEVSLPANSFKFVAFTWSSNDEQPSMHTARVDGFGRISNEVNVITFDRLVSATVNSNGVVKEQSVIDPETNEKLTVARPDRISASVRIDGNELDIRLIAPDGTIVIGNDGLIDRIRSKAHLIELDEQTLVVKYVDLNEKLRFFAIKASQVDVPLPEGEWRIKAVDMSEQNTNVKIKYYVNYIRAPMTTASATGS